MVIVAPYRITKEGLWSTVEARECFVEDMGQVKVSLAYGIAGDA